MINENCVLIVGAGGSVPYSFPTAKGLKSMICINFEAMWEKFVWEKSLTPFSDDYLAEQKQIAKKIYQ